MLSLFKVRRLRSSLKPCDCKSTPDELTSSSFTPQVESDEGQESVLHEDAAVLVVPKAFPRLCVPEDVMPLGVVVKVGGLDEIIMETESSDAEGRVGVVW